MPNQDFAEKLAQIRAPYCAWLQSAAVGQLQQALEQLATGPLDSVQYDALLHLVHRLKGTGATYGFDAISLQATPLHDALSNHITDIPILVPLIDALVHACADAAHDTP